MPELPEVETIRRIIEPQISGRSITSLGIHNPQIIAFLMRIRFRVLSLAVHSQE